MTSPYTVLIVEDEPAELRRLERGLQRSDEDCQVITATSPVAASNQFRRYRPEVVLLDLSLSGYGPSAGLDLISRMNAIDSSSGIIVLTGYTSEEIGVQAIKNGAASFLTKPTDMLLLQTLVRDYVQTSRFRRSGLPEGEHEEIAGFVGRSPAMQSVYRLIRQCAATDSNVFVVGETGTGKELVAKAIHDLSPRRAGPLSIYFGSAPGSMAEAELFGYVRGAFTGASPQGAEGCLRKADRGSLFIDELCSLDLDIQRKLLRAIEEKTFKPLGSEKYQSSDFRLIGAAQPRIYDYVRTDQFREDLLARVEVLTIKLPPLRDRITDIQLLAEDFLLKTKDELARGGVPCRVWGFTNEAIGAFTAYSWPRNVRELKHVVHHGVLHAQLRGSDKIDVSDIENRLEHKISTDTGNGSELTPSAYRPGMTLKEAVEQVEVSIIRAALKRHENSISAVCQELGVGRTTLWRKLKHYEVEIR